ncbi:MAG TPA: lysophospholipid acyltransferase family protein [Nitrospinota bacterium]|jgi:hypothetical protein|nr:lysophospholipid acyltransferase family protein [Nitrospinota bacterium]|tara:strand:+ start:135100 stop:135756 length:657 start_codon:yes stop_codon:yes gene_type:complete
MKSIFNIYVAPFLAYWLLRLLSFTLRLELVGEEIEVQLRKRGPTILLLWHGRLLYYPHHYRNRSHEFNLLVSPSSDGEIMARVLTAFGFQTIRGSSYSKARSALRELKRSTDNGNCTAMIADGSRGPVYKLQSGALMLAKLTGAPILPTAVSFSNRWTLNSWDKLMIPKPFSKVIFMYEKPVYVPSNCSSAKLKKIRVGLEKTMIEMTARADTWFNLQ